MSRSTNLFIGLFASFALSCVATVLIPQAQLGALQPQFTDDDGKPTDIYPIDTAGIVEQGRKVYISQGCIYCHTQQVRDPHMGTDILRGWGTRRTVARDYIYDSPALLGTVRLGPDLANNGSSEWRNEAKGDTLRPAKRDAAWHYLHLYNPKAIINESIHPPYRYLFEKRKISGERPLDALNLVGKEMPAQGYTVVPTSEAEALVGYLLSLDRSFGLPEAKTVLPSAPATAGASTAAPAAQ
jgi:cytochrome c oxidase cbb3-type subunit 2